MTESQRPPASLLQQQRSSQPRLRVAAIDFLNPAPLMWDFEHPPLADSLATRYALHYTQPSQCAAELLDGTADLGLIPIAALTPALAIVPGCTIASLDEVRSILLIVKGERKLEQVRTLAADTASRSSVAYAQVLFRHFLKTDPTLIDYPADPIAMLARADAALIIGDPALLARERRAGIEAAAGPCLWTDLAHEWRTRTGLPWVAAVWAVRPEALVPGNTDAPSATGITASQLTRDLQHSRDHGLANIDSLVREWALRLPLSRETIQTYLTHNIHYTLDPACIETLFLFRKLAAETHTLPPLTEPRFL